jgi:acetyl esterase
MTLHPQAQALLDRLAAANVPSFEQMGLEQARQATRDSSLAGIAEDTADIKVEDRSISGLVGELRLRIYTPSSNLPLPIVVFVHGGGWIGGDLDTLDVPLRVLAHCSRCIMISVDYPLAPEHPFPIPVESVYLATEWVIDRATALGGDPARVAISGDSSGGNLAAAVTLMARDRKAFSLAAQLLICPIADCNFETTSYQIYGRGYLLTRAAMEWFWQLYLGDMREGNNPYASPLKAPDLAGLPPAFVITAEYDPLRDEGEAYASRLREAGVSVSMKRFDGMMHGFYQMGAIMDAGRDWIADAAQFLKSTLTHQLEN